MSSIKDAITYETAIEIIPTDTVSDSFGYLNHELIAVMANISGPWVKMPVEYGGVYTCNQSTIGLDLLSVPIRMTHTGPGNKYQPKARCINRPDLNMILRPDGTTAAIAVFDGIMETVGTLIGVQETLEYLINEFNTNHKIKYKMPLIHNFVLVDKSIDGDTISNLHAAIKADNSIWYHGAGADDKSLIGEERGRDKTAIMGRLPDDYKGVIPETPYYTKNF